MENCISSKPYKQWCKARGMDFISHISKFPFVCSRLGLKLNPVKLEKIKIAKTSPQHRLVNFIKRIVRQLSPKRAT